MTDVKPQNIDVLRDLIASADSLEQSWSIGANGMVEKRYLLFFDQLDFRSDLIAKAAMNLGVSAQMVDRWKKGHAQADAMGLAFNEGLSSVRLYLQYWDRLVDRVKVGNLAPFPLYLGLKSLPNGQMRDDVYICHPLAAQDVFGPAITEALARIGILDATDMTKTLTAEACIFTTIAGGGRSSFLATVRRADLNRGHVAQWMAQISTAPWVPAVKSHATRSDLLHIAGGVDPLKGAFTTLYFSCNPTDIPV